MNTTTTIPTETILKAAKNIKKIAYAIAGIGTIASYGTQVVLLVNHHVGTFSYVIPATIDLLAIAAAMVLQLPAIDNVTRKIAGTILTVAVIVSILANTIDAHNAVEGMAHAWPVAAYLMGEMLANRVRAYAAKLMAAEAAKNAPVAPVAVPAPIVAPVVTRARKTTPHAVTTRTMGSHANCTHASTPKDRAACRAGR